MLPKKKSRFFISFSCHDPRRDVKKSTHKKQSATSVQMKGTKKKWIQLVGWLVLWQVNTC